MKISCDIDNCLLVNPFDLDLPDNHGQALDWFNANTSQLSNIKYNYLLINWLACHDSIDQIFLLTNRGIALHDCTVNQLFEIGVNYPIVFCNGMKNFILSEYRKVYRDLFVIDNNIDYDPDYLITEMNSLTNIELAYFKKFNEVEQWQYSVI